MRPFPTFVIRAVAPLLGVLAAVGAAHAQTPGDDSAQSRMVRQAGAPVASANDSLFRRAERLVRDGRGEAGRALVDTLAARTRPGSSQHGQALYWQASLAADAAEAERGYRRVIVEYPATRWAGDALLNLAQLELARGDEEQALIHLHRFGREYTSHESRARASFWLARLHFDKKNDPRGCAALATARVAASPEDVELRNRIEYYGQRCIGVDTTGPAPARVAVSTPPAPAPANQVAARDTVATEETSEGPRSGGFTVQVAAFDTRAPAEQLIERLKTRGYTARLASTSRPFRVRVGRYETRAAAAAAQQRLKSKGIDGFVTETERP